MRSVLTVLALLCLPSLATAQTHPCDTTPGTTVVSSPFTVQACHDGKTENGETTTIATMKVFIDAATTPVKTGAPTVGSTANAAGEKLYSLTGVTAPKGAREVRVVFTSVDGVDSEPSTVYNFSVQAAKPTRPTRPRVVQGS